MKKFNNFIIIAHFEGVVERICSKRLSFGARITSIPLDKKTDRALKQKLSREEYYESKLDGYVDVKMEELSKCDRDSVELGKVFDWYLGYCKKPYATGRTDKSLFVFRKKYGKNGKRINMKKVKEWADQMMKNLQWD